jgi:cell pole-organizing protein PopZ
MEEILASIRRIIADDEAKPAKAPDPVAATAPTPVAAVVEKPAPRPAPAAAPSSFRTIDGQSDDVFSDPPPESAPSTPPEPTVRVVEEARKQFVSMPDRALLSATTANAVDNAFNSLAHTVLGNNARTLEDLVKEMLRPMLKSWLDDNLPGLVDRIVRAEIERVSRGR